MPWELILFSPAIILICGIFKEELEEKKKQKKEREEQQEEARYLQTIQSIHFPHSVHEIEQKKLINYLADFCYKNETENFEQIKVEENSTTYSLKGYGYVFVVTKTKEVIDCHVKKDGDTLIDFSYDYGTGEFTKKMMKKSVLMGVSKKEALEIVDQFMGEIVFYDWRSLDKGITFIDDTEQKSVQFEELESVNKIKDPLLTKMANIAKAIDVVSEKLDDFDLEKRHMFKISLKEDVKRLYDAYVQLDERSKNDYAPAIEQGLENVKMQVEKMNERIKQKEEFEIEIALQLISSRYTLDKCSL